MKIYYIANIRMPTEKAHGIQIMKMCEAFADLGNKVELVLPGRRTPIHNDSFEYYGIRQNIKITHLNAYDPVWLLKFPQGWYTKLQALFFVFKLKKRLSNLPQDSLLYTRDGYLLPILLKFSDRIVWEAHDLPINRSFYIKYWRRCKTIIVISHGLKNELTDLGISERNILVAPDGVDLEKFDIDISKEEARLKLDLPRDAKIVMYTGHLYDWKGADVLLEAAREIKAKSQELRFVFVGGTEGDVSEFKKKAKGLENVSILGWKPHEEIPFYLKAADVLILPNSAKSEISSKYTSPMKLFEYMASGRPIVASDLPSMREIINEKNALLAAPDEPEALNKKITEVLSDKERGARIVEQAKRDVKQYAWQKRAERILEFSL